MRSFDTDPIRALKLDILTTIATEASIHTILREFQVAHCLKFSEVFFCKYFEARRFWIVQ